MYFAAAGAAASVGVAMAASALEGSYVSAMGTKVAFSAKSVHVEIKDGPTFDVPLTVDGNKVTFNAAANDPTCPGQVGVYTVAESGDKATFTAVSDSCAARKADLTAGALTKAK
jgi:hypothetical protein